MLIRAVGKEQEEGESFGKTEGGRREVVYGDGGGRVLKRGRSHTEQPGPPGGRVVSLQTSLPELGEERLFIKIFSPRAFTDREKSSPT